ncbi:hypothetical protein OB905_03825 [Halobacteria archaeon AArc-dxtr1]|nr:hypothetical protein [Halobacteria archaeon AArc-dxtr1]
MTQTPDAPTRNGVSQSEPLVERTLWHSRRLLLLAIVPFTTAILNVSDLLATAHTRGLSITASFPVYRYDLWSFVDAPDDGGLSVTIPFGTVESVTLLLPLLVVYVFVSGILSAGYFGSIAAGITTGSFDFADSVAQFATRIIALELLVVSVFVAIFVPLLFVPPLFVLAVLALLVAAYLLFPTVYILVLEDRSLVSSMRRAYYLVTEHNPVGFFIAVALVTLLCSVPLAFLAYSGLPGALIAVSIAAPLGLAFNVGVALKVAEMADLATVR